MAERDRLTLSKGVRLSCIAARKDLHACSLLILGETQLPRATALVHSLCHSNNVESWQTVRSAGAPILLKGSHAGSGFDVWMQGETCMLDSGGAVPSVNALQFLFLLRDVTNVCVCRSYRGAMSHHVARQYQATLCSSWKLERIRTQAD